MEPKTFGENALKAILGFKWELLGNRHKVVQDDPKRNDGIWVVMPLSDSITTEYERAQRFAHPTGDLDSPALPIPCTAAQFIAFCKSELVLESDIEGVYSNDDGTLDEAQFALLSQVSPPAAELVRRLLAGEDGPAEVPPQEHSSSSANMLPTMQIKGARYADARNDQLLLEILEELGLDPATIPRHRGGAPKITAKSRARQLALTPAYASQGLTVSTFKKAWERLPKVG
jgi:hypothetical protein